MRCILPGKAVLLNYQKVPVTLLKAIKGIRNQHKFSVLKGMNWKATEIYQK